MSKNIVIAIALILNCMVTFTIFPNIVALTTLGFPKYLSFSFCSLSYDLFSILGKAIAKKINTKKKRDFVCDVPYKEYLNTTSLHNFD